MGNEVDENDKRKILTNKSSFNQSNCREIQDSDSELGSKEDFKKDLSKHIISDPKDPNKEEYRRTASIENIACRIYFCLEGGRDVR